MGINYASFTGYDAQGGSDFLRETVEVGTGRGIPFTTFVSHRVTSGLVFRDSLKVASFLRI